MLLVAGSVQKLMFVLLLPLTVHTDACHVDWQAVNGYNVALCSCGWQCVHSAML